MKSTRQSGAALLAAMLTVTLVATLAASALWQQWRDVEIETSERGRVQAAWMLSGALDWSRLILREDYRAAQTSNSAQVDSLGEPWAVPLQEARLSSFLAADQSNSGDGSTDDDVFLSGVITDAQALFNLRNLVTDDKKLDAGWLEVLQALCVQLNLPEQQAQLIAQGMVAAQLGESTDAPLLPQRLDEIAWFGVSAQTIQALAPYANVLPYRSPVNLNTAPVPVLAAVLGVSISAAQKVAVARTNAPFKTVTDVQKVVGTELAMNDAHEAVTSSYFDVRGRLRLQEAAVEERSLVRREQTTVRAVWRERGALGLQTQPLPAQ